MKSLESILSVLQQKEKNSKNYVINGASTNLRSKLILFCFCFNTGAFY